jgi:type I restriction enzyme R subunit
MGLFDQPLLHTMFVDKRLAGIQAVQTTRLRRSWRLRAFIWKEVERFSAVYFKPRQRQSALDHQAINAALDPAVSRFMATVSRCYTGVYACSANIHRIER